MSERLTIKRMPTGNCGTSVDTFCEKLIMCFDPVRWPPLKVYVVITGYIRVINVSSKCVRPSGSGGIYLYQKCSSEREIRYLGPYHSRG